MKLGLLNDTHLTITSDNQLTYCFRKLAKENPDIIIHAGDYSGATVGNRTLRVTLELMRKQFPDTPIVSTLGNHEWWCGERAPMRAFYENYDLIKSHFKNNKVHFLDEDGVFRKEDVTIFGCSGWYQTRPDSNDWKFIPKYILGDTHTYLQKRAMNILDAQLLDLKDTDTKRIFVSHFPVQDCNPWDWNHRIGEMLEKEFKVQYFISGHSHGLKNGPKHFRTATQYGLPEFLILNV